MLAETPVARETLGVPGSTGQAEATAPSSSRPSRPERTPAGSAGPKVGYVVKVYPRFSETFIVREITAREAQGEEIAVASLRAPNDTRFHSLLGGVRAPVTWISESAGRSSQALWESLRRAALLPGFTAALPGLLAEDVDVSAQAVSVALWAQEKEIGHLHAHFASLPGRTTRHAALLLGVPYSVTAHAKDIFVAGDSAHTLDAVLADAAAVVTVSDFNVRWLARHHPTARTVRVYNGLDLDELSYRAPVHRERVIAAVGRLVPKKGFDDLVEAVAALRATGDPVRLVVAGTGSCEGALRAQVDRRGIADAVDFTGPIPQHEVMDLLRRSAVFAAPCVEAADGDRDGLPTVLLEAMALGTPVVATGVTGIPEVVLDGITGSIVPQRDPVALAHALRTVLDSQDRRLAYSRAGRTRMEQFFDVRTQARALAVLTASIAIEVVR